MIEQLHVVAEHVEQRHDYCEGRAFLSIMMSVISLAVGLAQSFDMSIVALPPFRFVVLEPIRSR